jgi:predicted nucleotidyltransferase
MIEELTKTNQNYCALFKDFINQIRKNRVLHAAILFGSRATGHAKDYSDFDILLIGEFPEEFIYRSKKIIQFAPFLPIDLFCYTLEEFDSMFTSFHLTAMDAIGEGIILFDTEILEQYQIKYETYVKQGMKKLNCVLIPPLI